LEQTTHMLIVYMSKNIYKCDKIYKYDEVEMLNIPISLKAKVIYWIYILSRIYQSESNNLSESNSST
jgi:hypothetical protein